ncbi:MAG TPA: hypothetical protein VG406_25930 [Isosphaeraceae bacterium]|jgi:hypothetical protein|nr:hypothetical protein [Isosphaeraceae bacterium]
MTEPELRDHISRLIDAILPDVESLDDAGAAVSILIACLTAQRDGRLDDLARSAWAHLDRARHPAAAAAAPTIDRPADVGADPRWERFERVWSRSTSSEDPRERRFSDLWYRALLTRVESQEAWQRARTCVEESRRCRALRPL